MQFGAGELKQKAVGVGWREALAVHGVKNTLVGLSWPKLIVSVAVYYSVVGGTLGFLLYLCDAEEERAEENHELRQTSAPLS